MSQVLGATVAASDCPGRPILYSTITTTGVIIAAYEPNRGEERTPSDIS